VPLGRPAREHAATAGRESRPRRPRPRDRELETAQQLTRNNTGLTLYFCVNYGGRAEIGDAVQRIAADVARGRLKARTVDERTVARYLPEPAMV